MPDGILYSDEEIEGLVRNGLLRHVLHHDHPDMVKVLNDEVDGILSGLTTEDMRNLIVIKFRNPDQWLTELISDYKSKKEKLRRLYNFSDD